MVREALSNLNAEEQGGWLVYPFGRMDLKVTLKVRLVFLVLCSCNDEAEESCAVFVTNLQAQP